MPTPTTRCRIFSATLSILFVSISTGAFAENWPQWRGPSANGISGEKDIPVKWDKKEHVAWRIPLPGRGGATPAIWDDKIFVTSVADKDLVLLCIKTDGKELWRKSVSSGNRIVRGGEGDSASPSPSTDGEFVWALMANGEMGCFAVSDGKEIWKQNLSEVYGPFHIQFGMTSTPVLFQDRLLFQFIHGDMGGPKEQAFVLALDKMTGRKLWREDRFTNARIENRQSYASPSLYRDDKNALLITHGGDYVVAYDAIDGHEVWRCGGLNRHDDPNKRYHETLRFVASPVVADGMVVVPTAKQQKVIAIRPDGKGDVTDDKSIHIWERANNTPDVPSPLVHEGLVYLCRENGNLVCLDAKTGNQYYEKRTTVDRYRSSPVFADGHIYVTSRGGVVTVVKAGTNFEMVSQNNLDEEMSASPAISNGSIYLRTFDALWAIRN